MFQQEHVRVSERNKANEQQTSVEESVATNMAMLGVDLFG